MINIYSIFTIVSVWLTEAEAALGREKAPSLRF